MNLFGIPEPDIKPFPFDQLLKKNPKLFTRLTTLCDDSHHDKEEFYRVFGRAVKCIKENEYTVYYINYAELKKK